MCEFENIPLNRKNNNCQQSKQVDAIIGQQVFFINCVSCALPFFLPLSSSLFFVEYIREELLGWVKFLPFHLVSQLFDIVHSRKFDLKRDLLLVEKFGVCVAICHEKETSSSNS